MRGRKFACTERKEEIGHKECERRDQIPGLNDEPYLFNTHIADRLHGFFDPPFFFFGSGLKGAV